MATVGGGLLYVFGGAENSSQPSGSVQVVGSESMRPVVTACAEDFMNRNPQADIIVRGGGSGDGIATLLHGIADVGMTSRQLSQRELDYAASKGFELAVFDLALDGIAIIVNRANPVAALDIGQVRDIFTGKVRNWRELGGADIEIAPFARGGGSGTAAMFGERVLGEEAYAPSVRYQSTNEAIVNEVANQPGAIGYTGLGALKGDRVKPLPLAADSHAAAVSPTADAIRSSRYPLTRMLHFATAGRPAGSAKAFLDSCPREHALLLRAGYVVIDSAVP